MASITFELVLGDDQEVYDNLRASLPAGENNLARGLVIPAHPNNQPQTFKISNVTPGISYIVDFTGEWQAPTTPRMYIVPIGTTHSITVALPYGPVTVSIREASGQGDPKTFLLSVVHYATLFRSYAYEITQFSSLPLKQLEDSINTPLSFRLATPLLVGLTNLIPADLETLASLAYKLLVKNLLHVPGTLGATTEILAAFSASNPIFFKMQNINKFDSPLFRSEEVFQGYEAHVWLPNNEVERWQAFIHLLNNLPQLYTLKQITEGEVYVQQGGKMRRHLFDFDSPLANSITTGLSYLTDCFLRLFTCTVTVEAEHYLAFCQATYIIDQVIANALSPTDADPLGISPWNTFSLSGRFNQQFDINSIHDWVYDTPLIGAADGVNRYFRLTKFPISTQAVKVFVDGLLKRLYIDYRVSLSGNIISNGYRLLSMPYGSLLVQIDLGEPRPFYGPVFSSLEARGGAPLQMLLTGVEQSLANISFVISHPPNTAVGDPQAISIHFVTPKLPNSGNPGENQYGQVAMTAGDSSYPLTFTQPTLTLDYQLLISLTVNPMPGGDPAQVQQVFHIVRERNNAGAMIEFSAPLAADVTLNWWVVEDDSLTLERGTLLLSDGMSTVPLVFTNGPYFDQVVLIVQLWEINPTFIDAAQYLVSAMTIGPGGTNIRFSAPIVGNNYRLDYALFPARDGDFVEFYEPPFGLVEAHYDIKWARWINAGLSPAPDGIRTIFTLPYPCPDPKAVYLALDGRLLTQGADKQYTVEGINLVSLEGNSIINSPVITNVFPTTNQLEVGMLVVGVDIPTNTVIETIDSATQITLSNNTLMSYIPPAYLGNLRGTVDNFSKLPRPFTAVGRTILGSDLVDIVSTLGTIELYSLITSAGSQFSPGTTVITIISLTQIRISSPALETAGHVGDLLPTLTLTFSPNHGDLRNVTTDGMIYTWIPGVDGELNPVHTNEVNWVKFASTRSIFTAQNGGSTVTFTFPPTYEQAPWVVYPVTDYGDVLPSSWDQGFLNYLPETGGEYATGWIKTSGAITLGDKLSVAGLPFDAVETATGLLVNSSIINIGSYVTFATLDVTLTGVSDATLPRGTITNVGTIALSSTVTWQTSGITLMGVASPVNENEFIVGVSQDADATALQTAINSHSILSLTYTASLVVISVPILGITVIGSPIIMAVLPSTADLVSGMRVTGTNIPANTLILSVDSPTQITLDKNATGSATVTLLAESLTGSGITLIRSNISNAFEIVTVSGSLSATNVAVNENYFTVGIGRDEDTASLIAAINAHSVLSLYYVASGGAGFTILKAKDIGGGFYNEALIDFGFSSKTNITGDTAPSSYNSYTMYLGEHVVSVPALAVDILANTLYRQFHPYYEGLGVRVITTGTLPSPLALATTYYVVNPTATTFQLSLTPYGTPIDLTSPGSGYHTFTSREVEIEAAAFAFQTTMISVAGNTVIYSPVITSVVPSTADLAVGMAVTGANIPANTIIKSIDSLNQLTLTNKATGSASVALLFENIFRNNEPVRFTTKGVLPAGLNAGQTYYAINITQNRFQVSDSISGSPVAFTDGGTGEFVVYSVPRFAAGLNQTLDSMSLATEIQKHPITGAKVTTEVADGLITVTSKTVGVSGNYPLAVTGSSMTVLGLSSGKDATSTTYATSKLCYYYDAPVTTLDGLSTRLWNQYGGDEFVFTYPPTLKQEGYYISEIYPLNHHPLDSTVANLPCNYPKGLFTQGFGTHFNETDILVDQPGELVIATSNLPVQEEPNGIINGINTIFTITFTSCSGQNSLMLWVDGVFQPSDKYTYMSMGSYGQLTLLTPPAVGQSLWAWYLPYGTACFDERVNALTGTINGTNQTFSVPDSPWADAPALLVYLEGLFILQTQDYTVINSNTQIQFSGALAPAVGQSLWAHYNLGSVIPADNWRQLYVATTDGLVDTFMIPHLLTSELPTSVDSVLVFLDGVNQGGNFAVEVDGFGNPTGNIIFTGGIPEANRRLEVAYIR